MASLGHNESSLPLLLASVDKWQPMNESLDMDEALGLVDVNRIFRVFQYKFYNSTCAKSFLGSVR